MIKLRVKRRSDSRLGECSSTSCVHLEASITFKTTEENLYPVRRATWRNIVVEFTRDSGRSEREWTFLCVDSGVALAKRRNEKFSIKAFIGVCDGFPFLCSFRSFGVLKQIITCIRVVHLSPFASFLFLHYPTLPDTPDGRDGRPIVVYMLRRL